MGKLLRLQDGFTSIEIILVVVVVVLIGIVGWLVVKDNTKTAPPPSAKDSTTKTVTSTSTISQTQAGEDYLEDVAPTNSAINTLITQEDSWTSKITGQQAEQEAQPSVQALQALEGKLATLANEYPPASTDIKVEITKASVVIADLQELSTIKSSNAATLRSQFISDFNRLQSQANIVRGDLGLQSTSS